MRRLLRTALFTLFTLLSLLTDAFVAAEAAAAQTPSMQSPHIEVDATTIAVGQQVTVRLLRDGALLAGVPVVAIYRPGSQVPRREDIGRTSQAGALLWTPQAAGLVRLVAEERLDSAGGQDRRATRDLSVSYGATPESGFSVLILAGGFLLVGASLGFRATGKGGSG